MLHGSGHQLKAAFSRSARRLQASESRRPRREPDMITVLCQHRLLKQVTSTVAMACCAIGALISVPVEAARETRDEVQTSLTINRVQRDSQLAASIVKSCSLKIVFGSFATGIDGSAFSSIWKLLLYDREVSEIFVVPWGREGEVTLCIKGLDKNASRRLFSAVKAMIPDQSKRAWTSVSDGQRTHKTKWPK